MKYLYRIFILFLFQFSFLYSSFSQSGWGIGACGLYNVNNKYIGVGARLLIPVKEDLWAVPYVYKYFTNGEFSGGISGMKIFYRQNNIAYYVIASGTFRGEVSVSVNDSSASGSKSYSAEGEAGLGLLLGGGCLKGFFEPRYAVLSEEFTVRLGLVYFLGCGGGKKKSRGGGKSGGKHKKSSAYSKKKRAVCPAYE